MNGQSQLEVPSFMMILVAIFVHKLGGSITITQADIDEVAYGRLVEEGFTDGTVKLTLEGMTAQ